MDDIQIRLNVKHNAADGSPGTWGPSKLRLTLEADRATVQQVEAAIKRVLSDEDVDDHTSVWGGAGPDCKPERLAAAIDEIAEIVKSYKVFADRSVDDNTPLHLKNMVIIYKILQARGYMKEGIG